MMRLASAQHGVVSRAQLLRAGVATHIIDQRRATGWLRALHRGVYEIGPVRSAWTMEMAAALACGEESVLSHRTASRISGVWSEAHDPRSGEALPMEVTVAHGDPGRRSGMRVYRTASLPGDEVTRHDGLPITTVSRTLIDLAGVCGARVAERALGRAIRRELTDCDSVLAAAARSPKRPGAAIIRGLLASAGGSSFTRSRAEERFLALVGRARLPQPRVNTRVRGYEVDFLWPGQRFVVEIDGYAWHSSREMFDRDRRRDAVLAAAGYRVTRVTWRQLVDEPEALLVRLGQALARTA